MCLSAQELAPRYQEVGQFVGMLGDEPITFVGTFDTERERSSTTINDRSGIPIILAQIRSIDADGTLTNPSAGFLIGPLISGFSPNADVTVQSNGGFYQSNVDKKAFPEKPSSDFLG